MRLATFNLMSGRSLDRDGVDAGRVAAAVAATGADVIGLQEVDRAQPRSGNADLTALAAGALDLPHRLFVPAVVGTPGESFRAATDDEKEVDPHYGVALASRWPVLEWQVTRLPPAPIRSPIYVPGRRGGLLLLDDEPRVLIAAVLDAPAGRLTVATTHLSFVPGWNVYQLRKVIRALRRLPPPRVLLADLNLPATPAALASGWRPLARRATYPSPSPRIQFDHVLGDRRGAGTLPAVVMIETPRVAISDHRPLVVEFANRS